MSLHFLKVTFWGGIAGFFLVFSPCASGGEAVSEAPEAKGPELWAGHQVTLGETKVPFIGRVKTKTESYVLAKVTRRGGRIFLDQEACAVSFAKVAGVRVEMSPRTLRSIPRARIEFDKKDGQWRAKPWVVGWTVDDLDKDGQPGVSIDVKSALCSGALHIQSTSHSSAVGKQQGEGLAGDIFVRTEQVMLGADSACLRLFSKDTIDQQKGHFAYRKVQNDATCKSLAQSGNWPVRADPGRSL
jgi:hypothetical protein